MSTTGKTGFRGGPLSKKSSTCRAASSYPKGQACDGPHGKRQAPPSRDYIASTTAASARGPGMEEADEPPELEASQSPFRDHDEEEGELSLKLTPSRPLILDPTNNTRIPARLLNEELSCPICLSVVRNCHTFKQCLHRFCQGCIEKNLRLGQKECPQCRVKVASRRALQPDPSFDAIVDCFFPDLDLYEQKEEEFILHVNKQSICVAAAINEGLNRQVATNSGMHDELQHATTSTPSSRTSKAFASSEDSAAAKGPKGGCSVASAGENRRSGGAEGPSAFRGKRGRQLAEDAEGNLRSSSSTRKETGLVNRD